MITIQTQSDGVLFNFQDSTRYLYGDGSILTPYNSLTLIADESNVLTFRKSASNDIFITAGYDELGYSSKEEAINDLKTKLFKATGGSESGITSGDVQTMIDNSLVDYYTDDEVDAALSGKADASDVTALENEVAAKADTSAVTAVNNALTAHTTDTGIHVNQQEKDGWNAKLDASAYTPVDLSEYWTSAQTEVAISAATSGKADTSAVTAVANDVQTVSGQVQTKVATSDFNTYTAATATAIDGKADTSAVTAVSDALSGYVQTSAITTAVTSASTDSQIPSAKAVFDAIPTGGTGGMDDDMEKLISSSLNDLNDRKIDASEAMTKYQRKGDYATNTALALKANSADVMTLTKSDENEFVAASALVDLNNKFGGLSLVKITESDYAALTTKDDNTLYIVVADPT